jgi:hypothetical protein
VSNPSTHSFIPEMSQIAREAGALLMKYFHQHLKIEYKGDADTRAHPAKMAGA